LPRNKKEWWRSNVAPPTEKQIPRFARNDNMSEFSIIGKPTAMIDAAQKTTGAGKYTDDLSVPGMLVGKILHSPYPHARIKRIDTTRVGKCEGVIAVVLGKDAPNPYGILPVGHDEPALLSVKGGTAANN